MIHCREYKIPLTSVSFLKGFLIFIPHCLKGLLACPVVKGLADWLAVAP